MNHETPRKNRYQEGMTLPIVMFLLVPLIIMGIAIAKRNNLEELMAASQRDGQQALMNAETGLALAARTLAKVAEGIHTHTADEIISSQGGDIGFIGHSLTDGMVTVLIQDNENPAVVPYPTDLSFNCAALQTKGYTEDCNWETDTDSRLVATSTGSYRGGERIVQAIFELVLAGNNPNGAPPLAIFAEDDLGISGNPFIWGPNANVHTNSDLSISGNPVIWGTTSASGSVSITGSPVDENGDPVVYEEGAALIDAPYVYPPAYKPVATLYLTADCDIYNGWPTSTHTLLANDVKSNPDWMGSWNCDYNKGWILNGDTPPAGFYYIEGNFALSANPGEGTVPISMSVVAEGYIEISGNPNLQPFYESAVDISDPEVQALIDGRENVLFTSQVLFLSGNDLKINGNPSQKLSGLMAAHMEFDVSGAPYLRGALIAENGRAQEAQGLGRGQEVTAGRDVINMVDKNWIGGDPSITDDTDAINNNLVGATPAAANMEAWREIIE
jgi:Tfp pilus assembly protein PilX